ncbi:MAG: TatD family hydrolase [bacterium]|nr:TatD family hydrolase [bacterium]
MPPKLFDIHSHLNFPQFDGDRDEIIKKMRENGIWTICVGADKKTSLESVALAEKYEDVYAAVGLHPTDDEGEFDTEYYRELASHPKAVAMGECGLDMFRREKGDMERQKNVFEKQIELAAELNKPLIIHCRQAHKEALKMLSAKAGKLKGDIHFFSGNWEEARQYLDLGFSISFAGPITFTSEYDEVIKKTPLDRIMAETDSPFAAPAPHRGRRNEPLFVGEVVKKIAQVREISFEAVAEATVQNAMKMFLNA